MVDGVVGLGSGAGSETAGGCWGWLLVLERALNRSVNSLRRAVNSSIWACRTVS